MGACAGAPSGGLRAAAAEASPPPAAAAGEASDAQAAFILGSYPKAALRAGGDFIIHDMIVLFEKDFKDGRSHMLAMVAPLAIVSRGNRSRPP